jgi:membrane fusion protein, copper/silver efflux system
MEKPNLQTAVRHVQSLVRKYWYVPAAVILVVILFSLGSWYGQNQAAGPKATGSRRILHYVDPMNPAHTSSQPGLAPCGMRMEPVYADNEGQAAGSGMPPGSVKITPEKQQVIGVRVAKVEKSPWTYTLRTVGKVAVDETRVYRLNAFDQGFVIRVYNNSTGSLVRKDEPLATIYNKELVPTLQSYFYAADAMDRLRQFPQMQPAQLDQLDLQKQSAELALINLGMSPLQFKDLKRDKKVTQEIIVAAPVTSFVLARNISPGQKFVSGEELYRLADLSRIWVLADLYENEAKYIRPGEKVRVTFPNQDEQFMATVSEVLPEFDPATLTLKVRLEMDNPKFTLRPGMFTDVEFPIKLAPTLNVPADAILDSGLKKTIFVDRGNGYFEPRRVKTGWRLGDRVEILEGLAPGESIVVSGNFLVDSESRMKLAAAGMYGEVTKDAVCGQNVDESKAKAAGFTSFFQNQTYYFCSEACKQHFEKSPDRFAKQPGGGPETAGGAAGGKEPAVAAKSKDPVCGQEVDEAQAKVAGLTSNYQGKTYYFCRFACNRLFDKYPERYLHPEAQGECGPHGEQQHGDQKPVESGMAKDPVCGLQVDQVKASAKDLKSEYQGKTYYFDQEGCKQRFDRDPQHYLSKSPEDALPQTYPNVPTDLIAPLRFKRNLLRLMPQTPNQEPVYPGEPRPGAPQAPTQAPVPPGAAHVMPQGLAQPTAPLGGAQQPMLPGAPQVIPKAPPQAPMPPRAAQPAVPPAPHMMPQGPPPQPQVSPKATPTAPQGPAQPTAPPGAAQVAPEVPVQPPAAPGEPRAVPRGPNPSLPRGLRLVVPRGPTEAMREAAEQGMREREADLKRQGKPLPVPAGSAPVVLPKSQAEQQKHQTPAPAQVKPQKPQASPVPQAPPPKAAPQAVPPAPPGPPGHEGHPHD